MVDNIGYKAGVRRIVATASVPLVIKRIFLFDLLDDHKRDACGSEEGIFI